MHVAHCDSEMAGANYSHFAKGSSNPDQNTAVIGRNWSFVRVITAIEVVRAQVAFNSIYLIYKYSHKIDISLTSRIWIFSLKNFHSLFRW